MFPLEVAQPEQGPYFSLDNPEACIVQESIDWLIQDQNKMPHLTPLEDLKPSPRDVKAYRAFVSIGSSNKCGSDT